MLIQLNLEQGDLGVGEDGNFRALDELLYETFSFLPIVDKTAALCAYEKQPKKVERGRSL